MVWRKNQLDLWDGQFFWQSVELGMRGIFITWQFNQNAHAFSGIRRLDAAFDFGNFFGVEEVKE